MFGIYPRIADYTMVRIVELLQVPAAAHGSRRWQRWILHCVSLGAHSMLPSLKTSPGSPSASQQAIPVSRQRTGWKKGKRLDWDGQWRPEKPSRSQNIERTKIEPYRQQELDRCGKKMNAIPLRRDRYSFYRRCARPRLTASVYMCALCCVVFSIESSCDAQRLGASERSFVRPDAQPALKVFQLEVHTTQRLIRLITSIKLKIYIGWLYVGCETLQFLYNLGAIGTILLKRKTKRLCRALVY